MSCLYSIDEKLLCGRPFRQLLQNFVMRDGLADHEVSLTCAVQLRTMLRREGANGNENTQATEAIRFREMGNSGQIIATFGGVDPHCLHCDWTGVAWI